VRDFGTLGNGSGPTPADPAVPDAALLGRCVWNLFDTPLLTTHEPKSHARELRIVVEIILAADVLLEPRVQILASDFTGRSLDIELGVTTPLKVVRGVGGVPTPLLERVEDVVERLRVVRLRPYVEVEVQREP